MSSIFVRNKILWIGYTQNKIHIRKTLKLPNTNEGMKLARQFKKKLDAELFLEHLDELTNPRKVVLLSEGFQNFCESKNLKEAGNYGIIIKYLKEITGDIPINLIDSTHINLLKKKLESKSHNTVVSYFNHLTVIFNFFKKQEFISLNPVPKLKSELKPVVTIPEYELELIIKNLEPSIVHLIKLMSLTGLRISEALNFKREHIDWNNNIIFINNSKANRQEQFPIYTELKKFLYQMLENGEWYIGNRKSVLDSFQRTCSKLKLKRYKLHDIRRTFISRYATKLNPIELKAIARHSDIKTTLSSYVSLDMNAIGDKL
jgi:integrase